MDIEEEQHWLVLQHLVGGRADLLRRLFSLSHQPGEILDAEEARWFSVGADAELVRARRRWQTQVLDRARRDQHTLRELGAVLLPLPHPEYPVLLAEIPDPPPLIYLRGKLNQLQRPWLAVVGSRKASAMGARAATEFASAMVQAGLGVCSGLAVGIDAAAHRAALDSGGATCAVIATGQDLCYPRRNQALAEKIATHGLLLSEFPLGSKPLRERFPQRNRIISGLSLGVLVIEAAQHSGSLITARMALEQNREVFALPHSIYHPLGRGCNSLLRQGARLVESPQEILTELGSLYVAQRELQLAARPPTLTEAQQSLYDALGYEPVSVDELALHCDCDASEAVTALMELRLQGLVEAKDGKYMRR
ncbi:MAG: DNA-processing protein DprA [Gammaproteobacteria bacterium]|nr:DNA-processing protein DprA [Gammaproteobacteria bacterium]